MDSYDNLPDAVIEPKGIMSNKFLELGIKSFKAACEYVHKMDYGYNSNYDDQLILFRENKGSCTSKHAIISSLAAELNIPLYKRVGIYKFTEEIVVGADDILAKYSLPYVPMVHCFLVYKHYRFDLTEGNKNGKKSSIEEFIHTEQVDPFISQRDEYNLYLTVVKNKVLPSEEMQGVKEKTLLRARGECIQLLKKNIQ
ncbi:MAG: hypothetical protein ACFFBD_08080 [Candidatus Hodarchaeota archaeon]